MKRKIFITGASGFIGSNLTRNLLKENQVHVLIRENSDLWRINDIMKDSNLKIYKADLFQKEVLKEILKKINPHIIIHTAVYGGLPKEKDSEKITQTNIIGTINLLNASQDIDYTHFINTGSSSEYGRKNSPMKETDLLEPNTEYGVSKVAATLYSNCFSRQKKKSVVTLRLFSPYGMFEEKGRLFPYVIMSCLRDKDIQIGNPNSVRDFVFVDDVLDAYKKVIDSNNIFNGEVFNVGSGEQHSVEEVLNRIFEVCGKKVKATYGEEKKRVYDSYKWVADNTKTKNVLGWQPKCSFADGAAKSVEWFKKNMEKYADDN